MVTASKINLIAQAILLHIKLCNVNKVYCQRYIWTNKTVAVQSIFLVSKNDLSNILKLISIIEIHNAEQAL